MSHPTPNRVVQCVVVTPERTVVDAAVDFVAVPMYDGELGVLPGRAPLIGRLGYGELRTRHGAQVERYFVDGGFAQVRNNVVTVLTPKALRASAIDPAAVTAQIEAARRPADTPEARAAQQQTLAKARAQLRIANKGSGTAPAAH
jgi:F-type H+-transporting ATPase subunit epsilon